MGHANIEVIIVKRYGKKRNSNIKVIKEFDDRKLLCARLDGWTQASSKNCQASLIMSMKRLKVNHIHIIVKKGEVYLVRGKSKRMAR